MYYLGVDLGGTTIKAGLFDEQLQLLKMVQKNTGASLGADIVLKRIEKCLEILVLKNNLSFEQIDALGIGVPGLLNRNDGISLFSPNFNNLENSSYNTAPLGVRRTYFFVRIKSCIPSSSSRLEIFRLKEDCATNRWFAASVKFKYSATFKKHLI